VSLTCRRPFLAWFSVLLAASSAHAVPPLITDDAAVTEKHTFEIYSGFDYESGVDAITRQIPTTEFDYGIWDHQEISLEIPYLSTGGQHGFGDIAIGTKYVFVEETKTLPMLSASFDWKLRNGSVPHGLGTGAFDYEFHVLAQKTWGRFSVLTDAGLDLVGNPRIDGEIERHYNQWFFGCGQQYQLNEKTSLLSEIYWQRAEEPGLPNRLAFNVGFQREIIKDLELQAVVGRSLRAGANGDPDFHLYVGLHWSFDAPWKKETKDKDK
jgi:hypothetical protein